ncbi:MAG: putative glycoside hydrolase family 15 protein [Chloroflexota bacterium]|nr:putative glycoside hydrolase family 15 protein [Chloroflexota bacterium]
MLTGSAASSSLSAPSALSPKGVIPGSTASSIGLWAADWGGAASRRSAAGWQAAALNDQILIGGAGVYKKWIPQLHAWNPKLVILTYNLGPYLQKGSSNYNTILASHPTWFAHDSRGRIINLPMFPGNYLMEMSDAGYRTWHAQQLAASVSAYGFDGAMVDSVGPGPLGHYASGVPVNPVTHKPYTATEYLSNAVLLLNSDKAALNGKYLAFNGLMSGKYYALETHILATSNADAGVSELFLRQPTASVTSFPTMADLQANIAMMADMAAHKKALLGWTKVWVNASPTQIAQWEAFALAAYLLGRQSASYLDFMPSHSADNTAVSYPNLKTALGAPLTTYTIQGSLMVRAFQGGTVTINTVTHVVTL